MDWLNHWENIYATKSPVEVSWYKPHLEISLAWIHEAAPLRSAAILDVGAGASTLVDDLCAAGYRNLNVLEISSNAIAVTKERLGPAADDIGWIQGNVTGTELPGKHFDIWHDRAVFHFLTEPDDRKLYRSQLLRALRPGGSVILATFSSNGPERCSGLPVRRYSAELVSQEFGPELVLEKSTTAEHRTPNGGIQEFLHCRLVYGVA